MHSGIHFFDAQKLVLAKLYLEILEDIKSSNIIGLYVEFLYIKIIASAGL